MKNVANSTYSEIMGLDEFLDRYTNPINREMYNELLNIFINKEEMDIFTSISEMISSEEQMEPGDITTIFNGLVKRSAIATLKNAYGIILTEEQEIRLVDIHSALVKLQFMINIDTGRAEKFVSIIDDREDDLDAYILILEDLGIDIDFIYNYIIEIEDGFLDTYAKILKIEIQKQEVEEDDLEFKLKLNTIISSLKDTLRENKSNLLSLAETRMSYLSERDLLEVINNNQLDRHLIPFELLVGYKLLTSEQSISDFFKDYTENITFSSLEEEENCFMTFKDLEDKYKIELSKRISK
jgi:hypothetical protein